MHPQGEFEKWLVAARTLDWSHSQRQASALLAFAWLQQVYQQSRQGAGPASRRGAGAARRDETGRA